MSDSFVWGFVKGQLLNSYVSTKTASVNISDEMHHVVRLVGQLIHYLFPTIGTTFRFINVNLLHSLQLKSM